MRRQWISVDEGQRVSRRHGSHKLRGRYWPFGEFKNVRLPKAAICGSYLHGGQFESCRIPVAAPVLPNTFLLFLLRNFYSRFYQRNLNKFNKKLRAMIPQDTITDAERRISHRLMI